MVDHNQIGRQIKIVQFFKIMRLGTFLILLSFVFGAFWEVMIQIENEEPAFFTDSNRYIEIKGNVVKNNFFEIYNLKEADLSQRTAKGTYYMLTTITTIGFGDFNPKSNSERIVMCGVFILGVALFNLSISQFTESLEQIKEIEAENEEEERLSMFFNMIQIFNRGKRMDIKQRESIERFFKFYWKYDKLNSFKGDANLRFFDELPAQSKLDLFKNYLFK